MFYSKVLLLLTQHPGATMANTEFTPEKFIENLKSGRYETATAARRGVGKALWKTAQKDEARAAIDKHFAGSTKAAAPKAKGKPGPKPKAKAETSTKVKGKPGPKPGAKAAKAEAKSETTPINPPKKLGRPAGSGKKVPTVPASAKRAIEELGTVLHTTGGLSEYELKLLELAIGEQNALSAVLAAAPAAKSLFNTLNVEEIQSNIDLFSQLTRRIESILGPALEYVISNSSTPTSTVLSASVAPETAAVEEEEQEEEIDASETPGDEVEASGNGVTKEEHERRSKLWSGALPIADSLALRSLLLPEQIE